MEDKVYVVSVLEYNESNTDVLTTICKTLNTAKKMFREKIKEYRNRVLRVYDKPFEKGTWDETGDIPNDEHITPNSYFSIWHATENEGADIWIEEKELFE